MLGTLLHSREDPTSAGASHTPYGPSVPENIARTPYSVTNYINIFENNFQAVSPELFLAIAATIILVYGVVYNPSASYRFPIVTTAIG